MPPRGLAPDPDRGIGAEPLAGLDAGCEQRHVAVDRARRIIGVHLEASPDKPIRSVARIRCDRDTAYLNSPPRGLRRGDRIRASNWRRQLSSVFC